MATQITLTKSGKGITSKGYNLADADGGLYIFDYEPKTFGNHRGYLAFVNTDFIGRTDIQIAVLSSTNPIEAPADIDYITASPGGSWELPESALGLSTKVFIKGTSTFVVIF